MPLYRETNGTFTRWNGEPIGDVRYPANIEQEWSDDDLADLGLYSPDEADPVPDGKISAGQKVERVGNVVRYVHTLEDAPIVSKRIPKDLIWRRADDDEAEMMEAALAAQPIRIRRIYEGATHIETGDELYPLLEAMMTQLFTASRAAELLAPV